MRATLASGGMAIAVLALVACRTTQPDVSTKTDVVAPMASAPSAADADAGAASAAPVTQAAHFHLTPSRKGRSRRFAPGVAIQRIDDGGATAVTLDPPGDDTSNGALVTATPLTPGHYRAHFLVATCAKDSPDGGCKSMSPKPDSVEFDVPASGDVDVDVK
jgi:hypothetical protein